MNKSWKNILGISFLVACSGAQTNKTDLSQNDSSSIEEDSAEDSAEEIDVVINEVLAKSDETEDWFELYNAGDESVDLSGYLVQDSAFAPWPIPDGTVIEAGGFLVIWADDALEEGLHASFKLSKDGEVLSLLTPQADGMDEVVFPGLSAEQSYGRVVDGEDEWIVRDSSTPGESNNE